MKPEALEPDEILNQPGQTLAEQLQAHRQEGGKPLEPDSLRALQDLAQSVQALQSWPQLSPSADFDKRLQQKIAALPLRRFRFWPWLLPLSATAALLWGVWWLQPEPSDQVVTRYLLNIQLQNSQTAWPADDSWLETEGVDLRSQALNYPSNQIHAAPMPLDRNPD